MKKRSSTMGSRPNSAVASRKCPPSLRKSLESIRGLTMMPLSSGMRKPQLAMKRSRSPSLSTSPQAAIQLAAISSGAMPSSSPEVWVTSTKVPSPRFWKSRKWPKGRTTKRSIQPSLLKSTADIVKAWTTPSNPTCRVTSVKPLPPSL